MSVSPLIVKYERALARNPRSRVFAPLADLYRKIGLMEKAQEVLQNGIRYNPDYVPGYVQLADYYSDLKQFKLAHATLRPLINANRDNIKIQKLFTECCLELGHEDEALDTLKYLLFLNPKDKEVAEKIKQLEMNINVVTGEQQSDEPISFDVDSIKNNIGDDFSGWMEVDTTKNQASDGNEWNIEDWKVEKNEKAVPPEDELEEELEDRPTHLNEEAIDEPRINHTLVDIYIGQGDLEKAKVLLEEILNLRPRDTQTIQKLTEVSDMIEASRPDIMPDPPVDNVSSLMDVYDKRIGREAKLKKERTEHLLNHFLDALRSHGEEQRN